MMAGRAFDDGDLAAAARHLRKAAADPLAPPRVRDAAREKLSLLGEQGGPDPTPAPEGETTPTPDPAFRGPTTGGDFYDDE